MDARRAAEVWGVSLRRVQDLCREGKVTGAQRFGRSWMIPEDTARPADFRRREVRLNRTDNTPLIRKTPFLDMTDLYHTPGAADACIRETEGSGISHDLLAAQIAYSRGDVEAVYRSARSFLERPTGFYAMLCGGILLSRAAVWRGDVEMWRRARRQIVNAPYRNEYSPDIIELSVTAMESFISKAEGYPEWFCRGNFENLPEDARPGALVHYVAYLLVRAYDLATGASKLEDASGLALMKTLPYVAEPLIVQMQERRVVMAEIYLRLSCASAYLQSGNHRLAEEHADRAVELCLADDLLVPLVEHGRQLGVFLEERVALFDRAAARRIKVLEKRLRLGWSKIHNAVLGRAVAANLSAREAEVVRLVAFGLKDAEIARRLSLSESSIKSVIRSAKNKTGVSKRSELASFI